MSDILVIIEHQGGKVKKTSLEILSKAGQLAPDLGGQVIALLMGSAVKDLAASLAPYGAGKVVVVENPKLEKYNSMAYRGVVVEVVGQLKPQVILGIASDLGRDLFPRVAAAIKAGLASDCTALDIKDRKLVAKKPVYAGKASVDVVFHSAVQMATTRPNSFITSEPKTAGSPAEVLAVNFDPGEFRSVLKEVSQGNVGRADLTEAEIIISGGRAMGNADNFKILHELADVIGATVGASRAAVDSGYASHDMQVGQTGKVVNPKLYFAFGISGAIQHLAGMRTSKVIVAVNRDPEAPIFAKADYGIVGDLFTLVPLLTQEFKKILSE